MRYVLLVAIAILPIVALMVYIYRQDKYQKEPIKSLAKAFFGGMLAIPLDILIVTGINSLMSESNIATTIFHSNFVEAGIPEEFCKFLIFMLLIWRDKNFDEYFDGIVYATFISLGFACLENIEYVTQYGFGTGISRALLSVPAHFLFGVVMGYFLSMAKFHPEKRGIYLWSGLLLAMLFHSLFDWVLSIKGLISLFSDIDGIIIYIGFLIGDFFLWKLGIKYIRKQQENSRQQNDVAEAHTEMQQA